MSAAPEEPTCGALGPRGADGLPCGLPDGHDAHYYGHPVGPAPALTEPSLTEKELAGWLVMVTNKGHLRGDHARRLIAALAASQAREASLRQWQSEAMASMAAVVQQLEEAWAERLDR